MDIVTNPIVWAVAAGIVFLVGRFALTFWLPEKHWINESLEGPDIKTREGETKGGIGYSGGGGNPGGNGESDTGGGFGGGGDCGGDGGGGGD